MRKIILSSERKGPADTTHNFSQTINNSSIPAMGIKLNMASIPFSWYPVNSTNNKIYFDLGGGTLTATLTPGNYDYTTLGAEIKVAMEVVSGVVTMTVNYDTSLNCYSITPSAGTISFKFGSNTTSSAYKLLGSDNTDTSASASTTFPNIPQITSPPQLYIRSNALSGILKKQNIINGVASNVLEVINVNADQGYNIFYENHIEDFYEVTGSIPQNLDIQITDYHGNMVDLRGADCYFEFVVV